MKKYQFIMFLLGAISLSACSFFPANLKPQKSKPSGSDGGAALSIDDSKGTATYGFYPQNNVSDKSLISRLEQLPDNQRTDYGWFLLDGKYYVKEAADPFDFEGQYNQSPAYFADGTSIERGVYYWYECSPITWRILEQSNGELYLLSELCLDVSSFYAYGQGRDGHYPNDWETSTLREFLNNDFFSKAFYFDDSSILETIVDNSAPTTDSTSNQYAGADTIDRVFCPSYADYNNPSYGFDSAQSRLSYTTDYGRARGVWFENQDRTREFCADYFTRSPSRSSQNSSVRVSERGEFWSYTVNDQFGSVRPAIMVKA